MDEKTLEKYAALLLHLDTARTYSFAANMALDRVADLHSQFAMNTISDGEYGALLSETLGFQRKLMHEVFENIQAAHDKAAELRNGEKI